MLCTFVLDLLRVTGVCNMLLGVWCALGNIHNMGCYGKTCLGITRFFPENMNRAKGRLQGRNRSSTFVMTALNTLGQLNIFTPKLVWLSFLKHYSTIVACAVYVGAHEIKGSTWGVILIPISYQICTKSLPNLDVLACDPEESFTPGVPRPREDGTFQLEVVFRQLRSTSTVPHWYHLSPGLL